MHRRNEQEESDATDVAHEADRQTFHEQFVPFATEHFFFRLCVSAHLPEAEKIIGVRKTTMAFEVSDGMFSQKGSRGQILCENEKHVRAHIHAHNVRVFGSTVLLGFLHKSDPLITDDSFKN